MKRFSTVSLLAVLVGASAHAQATDTIRYTVLIASRPAGIEKQWAAVDGSHHYYFEFNDRGRGPAITERIVLGPRGVPTLVETTGHDYYKNAVAERFTVASGQATWGSSAERGSKAIGVASVYLSMDGVPDEAAVLARALLAAPGGALPLLPDGEARINRVGELTVRAGTQSRSVVQYAITGIDLTPSRIWLDADGEFFAAGGSWFMAVREGWETVQPDLIKAQQAADSVRQSTLARTLARRPTAPVVFRHADLFDAAAARIRARTTVVVTGNRITAVGPDGRVAVPPGAETVDATGKTLVPGMWDMHVHTGDDDGLLHLAAGVTSVRDMANDVDELQVRRRRWEDGSLLGPRLLMAGFLDGPGPFAGPTKVLVSTDSEARAWIDRYAAMGYVQTKVYSSIKPELVPAIVAESHKLGLRVSGHIPNGMTADQAVRAGFDEIQHANFWFLNFWGDSVGDTRTPVRFTAVAQRGALLDLGSERVRAFIQLLKDHGTALDPTVNVFEQDFVARKGVVPPGFASVADRLPAQVRRGLLVGGLPVPEGMDQRYRDSFGAMLRFLKLMYDAGIPIEAGTDGFPGFAYQRELELYAQAGIPATAVLQIATLNAARIMHRDSVLGSIEPGKLADLILVDGNPTVRMSDIRRVALVMKDGIVYEPAALYRAIGVRP
ncbi:MAG TPA: amidohydrolase family protein [Gemmatimonadales bacterium]|nr:amidohydrolase family protein [Gemmatimonadales bacterium]